MKARTFIDTVTVHVRAGNGGNGCVSFRREKFIEKGGPDGGDGGHGGDVIIRADRSEDSLVRLYYQPHQEAENAVHGKGAQRSGRNGRDLILNVPCGTQVRHAESGEPLGEVVEHGAELVLARGGKGGRGNVHWKTATHQTPMEHTNGEPGVEATLELELKIVADAGLVGFPNAGKSSLLARLSDAHPKVAAYPFTTLNPIIGTVTYEDYASMRIADVPGLIKGAHEGVGLGHLFLRHVERASLLLFVIDMAGVDQRDPIDDYRNLLEELRLHDESLAGRPSLIVANKMDLPEAVAKLPEFKEATGTDPICVSSLTGAGIEALKALLRPFCAKAVAPAPTPGRP